jgi:NAD(P)-dependent dehydrogenase (short-subunit alcohol dehydrogenase family)
MPISLNIDGKVAQVLAFLASDGALYITGAAIPVTGGIDLLTL